MPSPKYTGFVNGLVFCNVRRLTLGRGTPIFKSPTKYVKLIIGYFIALLCVLLLTPQTYLLSSYKVPPKQVRVLPSNTNTLPYRLEAMPSNVVMAAQFRPRQTAARQFNFQFDENWPVSGPRSLFIPSTGSETRVYFGGTPIFKDTKKNLFAPGLGKAWMSYDVPRWMLNPGKNRLDVYVYADDARAGVRDIYFGPKHKVQKVVGQYETWTQVLPIITTIGAALIITLSILGLLYNKHRNTYLILGSLACLVLGTASLSLFTQTTALTSLDLFFRFSLPALTAVLLAILWKIDALAKLEESAGKPSSYMPTLYALAATGPLVGLAIITLPFYIPAPIFFATLALISPLPLLYVRTVPMLIGDLKSHNSKLENLKAKLSEQAEELDEQGQALSQEIKNRAVLEERQRFTRDIHDGIGGQLLSLLIRVRTGKLDIGEIAEEIQGGLNDLRLVVDSMDHTGDNLTAALTTFRSRANAQLDAADINLNWLQSGKIFVQFRSTRAILHIYRFLQESLSNIVRHADAKNVTVSLMQKNPEHPFIIRILDDGIGMVDAGENNMGAGKGLENLKLRAQRLGGTIEFTEGLNGKGTGIELTILLLAQVD